MYLLSKPGNFKTMIADDTTDLSHSMLYQLSMLPDQPKRNPKPKKSQKVAVAKKLLDIYNLV